MPIVADAAVAIRGDLTKYSGDLKKAEGQTMSLGGKLKAALSPAALFGGLAGGFAVSKVLSFIVDAGQAASDLGETVSKTGQIMGEEALPEMERWAEGAAQAFGQSKRQALDGAATFAIFGKSAGLAGDELVTFGQDLTELAGDLASFYNTSPEEAITAIGAALRGESEPIRRYGVLLDDATLRQRALRLGIIDTTKQALTPQQRVLAAQAEIFAQTADAQGDFERTSDGLANTQRQLAAEFENLQVEIGEKVLPIMLELANIVNDTVLPAISSLLDLTDGSSETWEGFARIMDQVTFQQGKVQEVMQATGKTYMESRDIIKDWNATTGESGDVLLALIERYGSLEAAIAAFNSSTTASSLTGDWSEAQKAAYAAINGTVVALEEGAPQVEAAAGEMADVIPEQTAEAAQEARLEAFKIPGEIAGAIIAGKEELNPIRQLMKDIIAGSVSDAKTLAKNAALLVNPAIAEALTGNSTEAKDAMLTQVVDPLLASIATLEPGAFDGSAAVPPAMQAAIDQNGPLAVQAMRDLVGDQDASLQDLAVFARQRGLEGIASLIDGMISKKSAAASAASEVANAAKSNMGFDAYSGGASSAQTFINGLLGTLTSWDTATRLQNAMQLMKTQGGFGSSMPKYGPFRASELRSGPESIAGFWLDTLTRALTSGVVGFGLSRGMTPSLAASAPAGASSVEGGGIRDIHIHLEDKMQAVRRPGDIGDRLRDAEYLGLLRERR